MHPHLFLDPFESFPVEGALVPALHFSEDLVISALKGQVKMRNEPMGTGNEFDHFLMQKVGLERGYADAVNARDPIQRLQQIHKGALVLLVAKFSLAIIASIHSGQHDLLDPLGGDLGCL